METILTIVAIASGIVVVVLLAKFYKKAMEMPNENPKSGAGHITYDPPKEKQNEFKTKI